jgi:hypothetical protein
MKAVLTKVGLGAVVFAVLAAGCGGGQSSAKPAADTVTASTVTTTTESVPPSCLEAIDLIDKVLRLDVRVTKQREKLIKLLRSPFDAQTQEEAGQAVLKIQAASPAYDQTIWAMDGAFNALLPQLESAQSACRRAALTN